VAASGPVRILGLDPGSQATGFGIIDWIGGSPRYVASGAIRTSGEAFPPRLRQIFDGVARLMSEYRPSEVAVERVFMHRNADSALKLGQARAAAICATFEADVPIYEYSARHIKQAVVGRGSAEKEQVQQMVGMILGVRDAIQPDAADALAAAICHANQRAVQGLLRAAAVRGA
jgi:crossover junction endodeoxyribonuclease RuvC